MFIWFFTIVFIAEIIVAVKLISWIMAIDRKVCEVNTEIIALTPQIRKSFYGIRIDLFKFQLGLNKFKITIFKKKEQYINRILKEVITGILFWALNTDGKKIIAATDLLISVIDFVKLKLKK